MKISYHVKFLDIILFNIYHWLHSPFMLGIFAISIGVTGLLNWQAMVERSTEYSLNVRILSFLLLEFLFFIGLLIVLLLTVILANISKMNKTVLTDCVIELNTDSISTESKYARAEYQWNAVQKLARNQGYLFLYVMQHGALIIPKRAFRSDEELENFWQACQAHVKTA